jgi:hypothetical protein
MGIATLVMDALRRGLAEMALASMNDEATPPHVTMTVE